jgi:solute carrier family 25 carnitine/acylcarnitine transporter 20/29
MSTISNYVTGSILAGFSSTLVGHPLDTIKVHLQTQQALKNASTIEATRHILQTNGYNISIFFRGIMPPLANQIIMNTVMFSIFHEMKSSKILGNKESFFSSFGSGLVSGFATALISTPTDLVKIRAQLAHSNNMDSFTIIKSIVNQNQPHRLTKSIGAFYKGNVSNLAREGVFTMVYLGFYDFLKTPLENYFKLSSSSELAFIIGVSSFTGALAWIASYPFDTIKTVVQSSDKNTTQAVKYIYKSGGWKSFYRGCFASTGRAMLVTSIRMVAFEWTSRLLSNNSR